MMLCGLLIATTVSRPLVAQGRSALDVGVSVVRFPDDSTTVAGPSAEWTGAAETDHLFGLFNAGGVGSIGGASGSVTASGGARALLDRHLLVQGGGEWFGIASSSTSDAAAAILSARVATPFTRGGLWMRGTASDSWREAGSLPGHSLEGGAWWTLPRARVSASVLDQHAHGQLFVGPTRGELWIDLPQPLADGQLPRQIDVGPVAERFELWLSRQLKRLKQEQKPANPIPRKSPSSLVASSP